MTTKADDFRRDEEQARARRNKKSRPRKKAKVRTAAWQHMRETRNKNVGRAAGKNAVVELEDTPPGQRPPRKSTRKTENGQRSSAKLEEWKRKDVLRPQVKAVRKRKAKAHGGPKKKKDKRARMRAG